MNLSPAFVYIVESKFFKPRTFKIIVTEVTRTDIETVLNEVYGDYETLFVFKEEAVVLDKYMLKELQHKYLSCRGNSKLPESFLYMEHKEIILETIKKINALHHLLTDTEDNEKSLSKYVTYKNLVVPLDDVVVKNEEIVLKNMDDIDYNQYFKEWHRRIKTTCILEFVANKTDQMCEFTEIVMFNANKAFLTKQLREIFPEFTIIVHDQFPLEKLAEEMLCFHQSQKKLKLGISEIVRRIQTFFLDEKETIKKNAPSLDSKKIISHENPLIHKKQQQNTANTHTHGHDNIYSPIFSYPMMLPTYADTNIKMFPSSTQTFTSPPSFASLNGKRPTDSSEFPINSSDSENQELQEAENRIEQLENSSDIKEMRERIICKFIKNFCHEIPGKTIQSARLFEAFRQFYNVHEEENCRMKFCDLFSQTVFSNSLKNLGFTKHRTSSGIIWDNLLVGQAPAGKK